jgi:hypothetical protein
MSHASNKSEMRLALPVWQRGGARVRFLSDAKEKVHRLKLLLTGGNRLPIEIRHFHTVEGTSCRSIHVTLSAETLRLRMPNLDRHDFAFIVESQTTLE